jgi:hypothetical protein
MATLRRAGILAGLEAACVGLLLVAPGNGHSIFWWTQLPAMMIVAHMAPHAGSCFSCAPREWAVGIGMQTLLVTLAAIVWPSLNPWRPPPHGGSVRQQRLDDSLRKPPNQR